MAVLYSRTKDGLPGRCTVLRAETHDARRCRCDGSLDGPFVHLDEPDRDSYLMRRKCAYDECGGFD